MNKRRKDTGRPFRFPFDIDRRIFLAMAVVFFILSIKDVNKHIYSRFTPENICKQIEESFKAQLAAFDRSVNTISYDELNTGMLLRGQLIKLNKAKWTLAIYDNDTLRSWTKASTGKLPPNMVTDSAYTFSNSNEIGIILKREDKIDTNTISLVGKFPLYVDYKVVNNSIASHFTFTQNKNTRSEDYGYRLEAIEHARKINTGDHLVKINGVPRFKLVEKKNFLEITDKSFWRFFFCAIPFILFGVSIHTYLKVSVNRNPLLYFSLVLFTAIFIRFLTYYFGFPDDYHEFYLFNPSLYASDSINKSLGDSFINVCLLFWILFFFIMNVQNKIIRFTKNYKKTLFLFFIGFIFLTLGSLIVIDIKSIIFDSLIEFDTTRWSNLNASTIIGLGTILLLFMSFVLLTIIFERYFRRYAKHKNLKYLIPISLALLSFVITPKSLQEPILLCSLWTALLLYLFGLKFLNTKFDFNSYKLIYWLIFLSISCVLIIYYFDTMKEVEHRQIFAQRVIQFENKNIENRLIELDRKFKEDSVILNPELPQEKLISYIENNYLNFIGPEYHKTTQISDTINANFINLKKAHKNIIDYKIQDVDTNCRLYMVNLPGREEYVLSTIISSKYINVSIKPAYHSVKKQFILPTDFDFNESQVYDINYYSFAIYVDNVLIKQSSIDKFPSILSTKLANKTGVIARNNIYSDIIAHSIFKNYKKSIIVRKRTNTIYRISTTYAYIFSSIFLLMTLYILGNVIARSNLRRKRFINLLGLTLRMRIQLAILLVELISMLIIGFVTIYIFTTSAQDDARTKISIASQEIVNALSQEEILDSISEFKVNAGLSDAVIQNLQPLLTKHGVEVVLYTLYGNRTYSSLPVAVKNILPNYINPIALRELRLNDNTPTLQNQNLGYTEYYTIYTIIRNDKNIPVLILEVPKFSSHQEIKRRYADIITMLINVYAFVFLLSSLIAFVITKRLTKSFAKIVTQFSKINLTETNEPLTWPYSDEIGLLIKEYNRTLRKLENSTALLAKSERELAWREMAKQIAHEIKNPLTPMSLSLQSLQMAIKRNDPNVPELTERMTNTVLEQIKVLTRIASNFSEFARMIDIDARKESLIDILESTTGIYNDTEDTEYLFVLPKYDIYLNVDKVKIIRVITNVIQNAVQSISADKTGKVTLTVTRETGNKVRVTVEDNGDGIPEEFADRVFEPNFTTKFLGSGLGLAMCKDIMLKSGGNIYFETEEGVGTKFHIEIPEYQTDDELDHEDDDLFEDESEEDDEDDDDMNE